MRMKGAHAAMKRMNPWRTFLFGASLLGNVGIKPSTLAHFVYFA